MRKVNYGIVGFGGIAVNRIAKEGFCMDRERFSAHPHAQLVGATSIHGSRKQEAEAMGLTWYDDQKALLDDASIEAVFIASNNLTHAPIALEAIEAGKHCIIEKPIATTVEDARKIVSLAREKGKSISVDHMMKHNQYNIKARDMIREGILGTVSDIDLHMEFLYGSTPEEAGSWRCAVPDELGGPIGDVASHCLYVAEFLLASRITSLSCIYLPETLDLAVENGAFIRFETESGVDGSIQVAFDRPRGGLASTVLNLGFEAYGDKGVLRSYGTTFQLSGHEDEPVSIRLELDRFTRSEPISVDTIENIYQAVISEHAVSILENRPLPGEEALRNLYLVTACHQSAHNNGENITISEAEVT